MSCAGSASVCTQSHTSSQVLEFCAPETRERHLQHTRVETEDALYNGRLSKRGVHSNMDSAVAWSMSVTREHAVAVWASLSSSLPVFSLDES